MWALLCNYNTATPERVIEVRNRYRTSPVSSRYSRLTLIVAPGFLSSYIMPVFISSLSPKESKFPAFQVVNTLFETVSF